VEWYRKAAEQREKLVLSVLEYYDHEKLQVLMSRKFKYIEKVCGKSCYQEACYAGAFYSYRIK